MDRRKFLKTGTIATTALAVGVSSASATGKTTDLKNIAPTSLDAEYTFSKSGNLIENPDFRTAFSRCFGCFNICGVRAKIDNKTGKVLRVSGNPYSPANQAGSPMDMNLAPKEAMKRLSALEDQGLSNRSTLCGRGNAVIDAMDDPHRITTCMKRTGKRGENKWENISYEQLLKEVINGGDLFGEGNVEGLKDIYKPNVLANPKYPDFGSQTNQLFMSGNSEQTARWHFMTRFSHSVWGTPNVGCKDAYCGHQQVAGCALGCFDGTDEAALPTVDYDHCEFAILIGTNPGLSGNTLNAAGRRIADARTERSNFKYVVVDPILRSVTVDASCNNSEWLPIRSGGDTALMFGMLQHIINNELYYKVYLAQPNQAGADKIGEKNFTNATYLVVENKDHPLYKKFLTAEACGLGSDEIKMVIDEVSGKPVTSESSNSAKLFFEGKVELKDGSFVNVKTAFSLLKKRVNEYSLKEYSDYCQISVSKIKELAKEFTSHGKRVAIETNTGCNTTDGSQFAFAAMMLGTMVAAHNAKGGMFHMNGVGFSMWYDIQAEPLYNLMDFEHAKEEGFPAERSGSYEDSNEYKVKVEKGLNPYPAEQAWTSTITQHNAGEQLIAHANANPFQFKVWINWSTNPLYNCSGLKDQVIDSILDPKQLGLIIAVDPYINETNINADYFIPDGVQYEQWENARMWGSEYIGDVACAPITEPQMVKSAEGNHVCMEQFLIDMSKELGLKGLGENAFKDVKGKSYPIHTPEDYYVPLFANVAHSGEVLPSPTKEDIKFTSVDRVMPLLEERLKANEVGPTAFMLTRGGRYENFGDRYEGEFLTEAIRMDTQFQIYNEGLTLKKDSYTGERYDGQPLFDVDRFWDASQVSQKWSETIYPFKFSTFKTQLRSPYSIVLPRVVALSPTNYIQMNIEDAKNNDLKDGDKARVLSPKGTFIEGIVQADETVAKGSIVVPTGYGHSAFGSQDTIIDGKKRAGIKNRGTGMAVNPFNVVDPTRKGASLYRDILFGCTARHGVPVGIQKV